MILEKKCSKELANFFRRLEKDIHKIIDEYWDNELGLFHLNKISDLITLRKQEYYDILFKYCKIQYDRSRSRTERLFNNQLKQISIKSDISITTLSSLFKPDPTIKYNLNNKIFVASEHTLNRVDNLVMSNLSESYEAGLGIEEAKNRLTVKYNGLKGWEAQRIARTEINSAQNDACFDMYGELGCDYQQWWTAQDERVRNGSKGSADHVSLHGKIVKVGTRFSNGLLYPGDRQGRIKEWINCRCTSIPYIIPLGKMAPMGMSEFTEDDLIDIPNWNTPSLNDLLNNSPKITKNPIINQEEFKKDAKRLVELQMKVNRAKSHEESQLIIEEFDQITSKFLKNNLNENDFYDYEDISKKLYKLKTRLKYTEDRSRYVLENDIEFLEDLLEYNNKSYKDYLTKSMQKSLEKEVLKDMDLEWYEKNYLKQYGRKFEHIDKLEHIEKQYPKEVNKIIHNLTQEEEIKFLSVDELTTYDELKHILMKGNKNFPNKNAKEILGSKYKTFKDLDDLIKSSDYIVSFESDFDLPKIAGNNYKGFVKESYYVLKFKKYDFEIFVGGGCKISTGELIKALDSIPKSLLNQNRNKLIISSSKNVFSKRHNQYIGGYCNSDQIVMLMGDRFDYKEFMRVLPHECGHALDNNFGKVSLINSEYYNLASSEGEFVSDYAEKGYKKFGTFYAEDFAEAIGQYINKPSRLKNKFPKRYKYINDLFNNKLSNL